MNENQAIGLISGIGFLVLVLSSLAARRPDLRLVVRAAAGWAAIALVIAVIVAYRTELGWFANDVGARLGFTDHRAQGRTVRIALSDDGHYWARARINGVERRMLIDSGATSSALSTETARAAGVEIDPAGLPAIVSTANGSVEARRARVERLQVGDIETHDLGVLVSDRFGSTDILGMNFLNRLAGWRTEQGVLILEPNAQTE